EGYGFHDARVVEIRKQRALAREARLVFGRDPGFARDHLQGDRTLGLQIEGAVHDADGAATDFAFDREAPAESATAVRRGGVFQHLSAPGPASWCAPSIAR